MMSGYKLSYTLLFLLFICNSVSIATERSSSYPFISGDTFRAFADHIVDETNQSFKPLKKLDNKLTNFPGSSS